MGTVLPSFFVFQARRCRENFRDPPRTPVLIDRIEVDYVPLRPNRSENESPEVLLVAVRAEKGKKRRGTEEPSPCLCQNLSLVPSKRLLVRR